MLKALKSVGILLLCLLLPFGAVQASEDPMAKDLTEYCHLEAKQHVYIFKALKDHKEPICERFTEGQTIRVTWDESVSPQWLCIQWAEQKEGIILRQLDANGDPIAEDTLPPYFNTSMQLKDGVQEALLISGKAGMIPERISLYSAGVLPEPFHPWQEMPDELDYLVVATHPDDDLLFMGTVNPVYGTSRGYRGTVSFVTIQNRVRVNEAENGVWASGARYRPIFLGLPDLINVNEESRRYFNEEVVTQALVRLFRQRHPLVVFTHDLNGEYGNWQHKVTAAAAVEAYRLAADPAYDPESAKSYGTWQVQKLYIHIYPENPLVFDIDTPLDALHGQTAFEVAQEAYKKHFSQLGRVHKVEGSDDALACNRFGMIAGQVSAGEDAFDNTQVTLLSMLQRIKRSIQWAYFS